MPRVKPKKGMALLLVMTVIVVVLTTVSIGATVLLNNLDASKGQEQASIAFISAHSAIEKVRGYYKNDNGFFEGCSVNDCINFFHSADTPSCLRCDIPEAMYSDGNRRYKVIVTAKNPRGISLEATGYKGPYNRTISAGIEFTGFTCGDAYSGKITDFEGNEYPTTLINGQCWMAASLRTKYKVDESCINGEDVSPCLDASVSDNGKGRSCFDNDEGNCNSESEFGGALYTWDAAMDGSNNQGARGICPIGWHIPTDAEWGLLENYLKDEGADCDPSRSSSNGNEFECVSAGLKLSSPDKGGMVNGFNGIGTGYRDADGETFFYQKRMSKYWSSTGSNPKINRSIDPDAFPSEGFGRDEIDNKDDYSFAVRCLQD